MTVFGNMVKNALTTGMMSSLQRTVTWNPDGGAPANITAQWNEGEVLPGYFDDAEMDVKHGVLRANRDDVSTLTLRDTFTIDSVVWAVEQIGKLYPIANIQVKASTLRAVGGPERIQR